MKQVARCIILLMFWLATCPAIGYCQTRERRSQNSKPPSESGKEAELSAKTAEREYKMFRVTTLIDRVWNFRDAKVKARSLAAMAGLMWAHNEDYARQLFSKTYEFLKQILPDEDGKESKSGLKTRDIIYLRRHLIAQIARYDTDWAQRLVEAENAFGSKDYSDAERVDAYFDAAFNLVENSPSKAAEFAEKGLRDGISGNLLWFLRALQQKDESAANRVFLKSLNQLTRQPIVDANDLLELGTYVFAPPSNDLADFGISPNAVRMAAVNKIMVVNISTNRPSAPLPIVRAYLDSAVTILTRRISAPSQKSLYYVAGYQLLPKVQEFLGGRAQELLVAMQSLVTDIPPSLLDRSTYKPLESTGVSTTGSLEEALRQIESITGEHPRNARCLVLAHVFYVRGDFNSAISIAEKLTDLYVRTSLLSQIHFGKAVKLISQGEIFSSIELAGKVARGVELPILWLAIANGWAQKGDTAMALEAANTAMKEAGRLNDPRRAYLLLATAKQQARLDPAAALQTLLEAVKAFNEHKTDNLAYVRWSNAIEVGQVQRQFSLKPDEIVFTFEYALPPLLAIDLEATVIAVSKLEDEEVLARALLTLSASFLK